MHDEWQVIEFDFEGYECDPKKEDSNIEKHGIAFEDAYAIFEG
jgi:uncharacterized DUF497 family protein